MAALLALVLGFGLSEIVPEIRFYDEGIYVANAWSLALGLGYRNLSLPDAPPQGKYPPVLPLVLGVIWRLFPAFPDNLPAMKGVVLLAGLGLLAAVCVYRERLLRLNAFPALATAALIGLNPFFLTFTTLATSDIPYALISVLTLVAYERALTGTRTVSLGLLMGAVGLAFLTRTVGLLLLAAIVGHLFWLRRVRWAVSCALGVGLVVLAWFGWTQAAARAYAHYPLDVRANYVGYGSALLLGDWTGHLQAILTENLRRLLQIWGVFVLPWGPRWLAGLTLAIAAYSLGRRVVRKPGAQDFYCAVSLLVIIIIPYPDTARYFLGISPFLIAHCFTGLSSGFSERHEWTWLQAVAHKASRLAIGALVVGTLLYDLRADAQQYARGKAGPPLIYAEFHRMLDWVREHTPGDAILVGDFDPGYYLFAKRKAIRVAINDNMKIYYTREVARDFPQAGDLLASFKRMKACYLIRDPMIGGPERVYFDNLIEALEVASPSPFIPVYVGAGGWFTVYRISDCPGGSG